MTPVEYFCTKSDSSANVANCIRKLHLVMRNINFKHSEGPFGINPFSFIFYLKDTRKKGRKVESLVIKKKLALEQM